MDSINSSLEFFRPFSEQFGTGNPGADLIALVVIFLFAFVACVLFLMLVRRDSSGSKLSPELERHRGLGGKIERVEMTVNSMRTDLVRDLEFLKTRVTRLESELQRLKARGGLDDDSGPEGESKEPFPEVFESEVEPQIDEPEIPEASEADDVPPGEAEPEKAKEPEPESLSKKLTKTRSGLFQKIRGIFAAQPELDEDTLEELEALLVSSDLGVGMAQELIAHLKGEVAAGASVDEDGLVSVLREKLSTLLKEQEAERIQPVKRDGNPLVVLMVGVNGVGKTTTTAKLATKWTGEGAKVLMVAADTFRAAATEQLVEWGGRIGVPVVKGQEQAKPATVVFEAMERAAREEFDVVLIDTAGRLHTRSNLMQELEGVQNVIKKHIPEAPHEVILVVDGSTGQNALSQAKEFNESVSLTGLVVTKLDGTPKGGILVAVASELGIPVRYIGVGEAPEDLRNFEADAFAEALLDREGTTALEQPSAHGRRRRRRREESQASGELA